MLLLLFGRCFARVRVHSWSAVVHGEQRLLIWFAFFHGIFQFFAFHLLVMCDVWKASTETITLLIHTNFAGEKLIVCSCSWLGEPIRTAARLPFASEWEHPPLFLQASVNFFYALTLFIHAVISLSTSKLAQKHDNSAQSARTGRNGVARKCFVSENTKKHFSRNDHT